MRAAIADALERWGGTKRVPRATARFKVIATSYLSGGFAALLPLSFASK